MASCSQKRESLLMQLNYDENSSLLSKSLQNKHVFYDLANPSISIKNPDEYSSSNCDLFGNDNIFVPFQDEGSLKSYFSQVRLNDKHVIKCIKDEKLTSMYSVVKSLQSFGVHDLNEQMYNHYKKEVLKQNKALKSYYRTPEKRFILKTSSIEF